MTVLRREDVQSRVASWDGNPYRIASSPILAIVPLIIRRLRGPSPNRLTHRFLDEPSVTRCCLPRRRCDGLQRRPQEARELARNRHGDLRCRLVFRRQFAEASTQSLLRLIGNRNHARRLSFAPTCERHADTRPVLVMPRDFYQQPPYQRVTGARDAAPPMFLTARVFAW